MADRDIAPRIPASKLGPPRRSVPAFVRPRLLKSLEGPAGIILICAPAGTGKTALLSSWQVPNRIWVRLDEGDQDPIRLVGALVAAVETADPGCGVTARAAL